MAFNINTAKRLLKLARLAYKNGDDRTVSDVSMRNSVLQENNRIDIHENGFHFDTECFVCHNAAGDIVVAFRGSESLFKADGGFRDWFLTDFNSSLIVYPPLPTGTNSSSNTCWVHMGFWAAYAPVRTAVQQAVANCLTQPRTKPRRIFTTGHSLGGALALLCAIDLGRVFPNVGVRAYTFAAPRIGNAVLREVLKENTAETYLLVNRDDPVPYTPPFGPNLKFGNKRYTTSEQVRFINHDFEISIGLPTFHVSVNPFHHKSQSYQDALEEAS